MTAPSSTATHTPKRNVRVHNAVWDPAKARAAKEGTNISAVLVKFLEDYAGVQTPSRTTTPVTPRR